MVCILLLSSIIQLKILVLIFVQIQAPASNVVVVILMNQKDGKKVGSFHFILLLSLLVSLVCPLVLSMVRNFSLFWTILFLVLTDL